MPCRPWQASPEARAPAAHGHRGLAYQESTCIRCRPFRTSPGCTLFSSDPRTVMGPPVGGRFVSWVQPGDRPHTRCGTMRCRPPSWHSHDPSCMLLFVEVRARPICCIPIFAGPDHAMLRGMLACITSTRQLCTPYTSLALRSASRQCRSASGHTGKVHISTGA